MSILTSLGSVGLYIQLAINSRQASVSLTASHISAKSNGLQNLYTCKSSANHHFILSQISSLHANHLPAFFTNQNICDALKKLSKLFIKYALAAHVSQACLASHQFIIFNQVSELAKSYVYALSQSSLVSQLITNGIAHGLPLINSVEYQ